jgi:uncharacterized protein YecT (DUF1311 family)
LADLCPRRARERTGGGNLTDETQGPRLDWRRFLASREPPAPPPEPEPFIPDLSELESRYEIISEIRGASDSISYLARHRTINREVTIDVVRAPWGQAASLMMQLQADARRESAMRHPNVVPVLEGRQIARDTFATVRPRVRGATLEDLLSSQEMVDTISPDRLASIFEQLNAALDWGWANGIVHRKVTPAGLVFQQGSGRALFTFEPQLDAIDVPTNLADDARTIGRLAWTMLAGFPFGSAGTSFLAEVRPDLPRRVIDAVDTLSHYSHDGDTPDIDGFIAVLRSLAGPTTPVRARIAPPIADEPEDTAGTEEYIVIQQPSFFGRRFVATVAIAAAVVTAAFIILRRGGTDPSLIAAAADSAGLASGDLALKKSDSASGAAAIPDSVKPETRSPTSAAPAQSGSSSSADRVARIATTTRPLNSTVTDVTKTGGSDDICSSPDAADQRACLRSSLAQGDNDVNYTYNRVIAALRKQANVSDDSPDPPSVEHVRLSQRRWLELRDATCHLVGTTVRYARPRALCYNGQSARRLEELQAMLDTLPQQPARPAPDDEQHPAGAARR